MFQVYFEKKSGNAREQRFLHAKVPLFHSMGNSVVIGMWRIVISLVNMIVVTKKFKLEVQ